MSNKKKEMLEKGNIFLCLQTIKGLTQTRCNHSQTAFQIIAIADNNCHCQHIAINVRQSQLGYDASLCNRGVDSNGC